MDWPAELVVAIALLLLFATGVAFVGMLVGAVGGIAFKRSRTPWRTFDRDAKRLHTMTHPKDDPDEDGP